MSKKIDERVVEMRFDNARFERNVAESMSTLEKLKKSLKLENAAKGFEDIDRAASKLNFKTLGDAIDTVGVKFSALQVVAVTALANIVNRAVDTGIQLVKALSVDQIAAGWEKFGNKTTSVATLRAQGYSMDEVEEQLKRLNWFTDETSYNFTDMVANIAKFTASGQDLKSSVTALEGIANWAALSGQNAQTASHAMYQLSQAMGAGLMRKEDYKSIQNVSMDTVEFRQKALDAAVALGTLKKNADGTYQSLMANTDAFSISQFAEHLTQDAWFTSDVMMKVYNDYSATVDQIYDYAEAHGITASEAIEELGDEVDAFGLKAFKAAQEAKTWSDVIDSVKDAVSTGWMNTFELIIGNYDEARKLYTDLANSMYDVFAGGAEVRNNLLSGALTTGWSQFLKEGISDAEGYKSAVIDAARAHGIAIEDIIEDAGSFEDALHEGWLTSDILAESLEALTTKTAGLSDEELANAGYTKAQLEALKELNESVKDGGIDLDEYTEKITRLSGRENLIQAFWNTWNAVFGDGEEYLGVLGTIKEAFRDIFPATTVDQLYNFTVKLKELTEKFKMSDETTKNLKNTFKGLFSILSIVKQAFSAIWRVLSPVRDGMKSIRSGILGVTGGMGEWLSKLDETIKENDIFYKALKKVADVIGLVVNAIKGFITSAKEKFDLPGFEGARTVFENIKERLAGIKSGAETAKNVISDALSAIGEAISKCKILQLLEAIWNFGKKIVGDVFKGLGTVLSSIIKGLGNADFSGVIDLLNGASAALVGGGLYKFLTGLADGLGAIGGIKDKVLGILDGVKGCLEAWQGSIKANIIKKIAVSVAILAAALLVLASIDSEKLNMAIGGITMMFVELIGALALVNKISVGKKVMRLAPTMIGLALGVLILAGALKKIADLSVGELAKGIVGIAALMTVMVAALKQMSKIKARGLKKAALSMVLIGAALKIMASVCTDLAELSWEGLAKGVAGIGVILAEFVGFQKLMSLVKPKKMISSALSMVLIGAALEVFANVAKKLGAMDWGVLAKAGAGIAGLLGLVAGFEKLSGATRNVGKSAGALLVISAALLMMIPVVKSLGGMDWDALVKAGAGIAGLFGLVVVFEKLSASTQNIAKSAAALLIMSAALLVMVPVIKILGGMDMASIGKALLAIGGSLLIFAVAATALSGVASTLIATSAAFALFGVAVLAIGTGLFACAAAFTALAAAGTAGAAAIVASLNIILTGLAALVPAMATALANGVIAFAVGLGEGAAQIAKAAKEMILALLDTFVECVPQIAHAALEMVAGVLAALVEYTPQIVDSIFDFLIKLLDGIAARLPELIVSVVNVIAAFFSGVAAAITQLDTEGLLLGIAGVGIMAGLIAALAAIVPMIPMAMVGVVGMGAVLAELAIVLAAIGALAQIPGLDWLINEGGTLLQSIGKAIGGFVGGIVGGFMSGVSSEFPQIGQDLADFMTNVTPFIEGAKSIDASAMDGVKALAQTILILTAADVLDSVTSWFTGGSSLGDFAKDLVPFGKAMVAFSNSIKGLDSDLVNSAAIAGRTLAEMAATIPNSGGILSAIVGDNDMDEFGEQLPKFGEAMVKFSDSVAGLNTDVVQNAAAAGQALAAMAQDIPNTGGVLGFIVGNNDMDDFGEQLVAFGKSLNSFALNTKNLDAGAVETAAHAGEVLVALAQDIPNSGGVLGFIVGNNDMDDFGEQIEGFGKGIAGFADAVKDVKPNVVTAAASAGKVLAELAAELPNSGGVVSWFTGDNKLNDFGKHISEFGEGLADYIRCFADIGVGTINQTLSATKKLVDTFGGLSDVDTASMKDFASALKDLGGTSLTAFTNSFKDSADDVKKSAETILTSFISGIDAKKADLENKFKEVSDNALALLESKNSEFRSAGQGLMKNMTDGSRSEEARAKNMFRTLISACAALIKEQRSSFYEAGKYLVQGFANGISANTYIAKAKAKEMAKAAADAAKAELNEHSPSKVGYEIGDYFGIGFTSGIDDNTDQAYISGRTMGEEARLGLEKALAAAKKILDAGTEFQPTIRPVVDLSEVQNGTEAMNRMFGSVDSGLFTGSNKVASATAAAVGSKKIADTATNEAALRKTMDAIANRPNKTFENHFNITGSNPREIALEVSQIIQKQVERRESSWA